MNDIKFDAIKAVVTNPFLKDWIEPVKEWKCSIKKGKISETLMDNLINSLLKNLK